MEDAHHNYFIDVEDQAEQEVLLDEFVEAVIEADRAIECVQKMFDDFRAKGNTSKLEDADDNESDSKDFKNKVIIVEIDNAENAAMVKIIESLL